MGAANCCTSRPSEVYPAVKLSDGLVDRENTPNHDLSGSHAVLTPLDSGIHIVSLRKPSIAINKSAGMQSTNDSESKVISSKQHINSTDAIDKAAFVKKEIRGKSSDSQNPYSGSHSNFNTELQLKLMINPVKVKVTPEQLKVKKIMQHLRSID